MHVYVVSMTDACVPVCSSCIERDSWFVTLNRTLVDLGPASGDLVDCFEVRKLYRQYDKMST